MTNPEKLTFATADKSKIPANAFRMAEKPFELKASGKDGKYPVRLVCRTSAPVESWFWGTCYHDLHGMKLAKEKLPIDYIHDDAEVIGFLDNFTVENGELVATGELTPFKDDDRAAELIHKLKVGVPYEASINFSGETKIEDVKQGGIADVNGGQVAGPCLIFREWTLRGVAICPYGADGQTSTSAEFSADEAIPVSVLSGESPAAEAPAADSPAEEAPAPATPAEDPPADENPTEAAPAEEHPAEEPPAEATPPPSQTETAEDPRALFRRMAADFGTEIAAKVFAEGGSYEDARAAKFRELEAEVARLTEENKRLAAAPSAGGTPATFTPAAPPEKRKPTLLDACTYGTAHCAENI